MKRKRKKAIPVAGHEGPYGCRTSRLPHFLDNQLTDGGEVVSPTLPDWIRLDRDQTG
jgi:hypothetical protein